jgi:hypothetical protein
VGAPARPHGLPSPARQTLDHNEVDNYQHPSLSFFAESPDDDQECAMPTTATSEIRKPATDTDLRGHWQVEPQTSHARFGAHTLAGLVETSGRFRSISEGLVVDGALAAGALVIGPSSIDMRRLFDELECTHKWLDRDRVKQGAARFRPYGPAVFSFAGFKTLLSYRESWIVKPLVFTGPYAGDSALNRLVVTARFRIDASKPGALDPGGAGPASAARVRIMQVVLRRRLRARPEWDLEALALISQSDALITRMSSSLTSGLAMYLMGYRTSTREIETIVHYWRYVGHLLGVQPRWYPETVETWWRNEMGEMQSHFQPAEELRR